MKLGVALALVIAFPTMAAAQAGLQLRPSPYHLLSGWEQGATMRTQSIGTVKSVATSVSDRAQPSQVGLSPNGGGGEVTGGVKRMPAPRY